jgi:hypothetical protein
MEKPSICQDQIRWPEVGARSTPPSAPPLRLRRRFRWSGPGWRDPGDPRRVSPGSGLLKHPVYGVPKRMQHDAPVLDAAPLPKVGPKARHDRRRSRLGRRASPPVKRPLVPFTLDPPENSGAAPLRGNQQTGSARRREYFGRFAVIKASKSAAR